MATQDLGWALGTMLRAHVKLTGDAVSGIPGGGRGYQVLRTVSEGGCGNQAEIAESLGLDRTVLTYLIDDLEKQDLVVRTPDPHDRRARRVSLTDAGSAAFSRAQEHIHSAEQRLLAHLEPADAQQLREVLSRAAASVDAEPDEICTLVDEVAAEKH